MIDVFKLGNRFIWIVYTPNIVNPDGSTVTVQLKYSKITEDIRDMRELVSRRPISPYQSRIFEQDGYLRQQSESVGP